METEIRRLRARIWLKRIFAVIVILLLLYFVTGYLGESAKIRVTVNNTTDYPIQAYAKLNISNYLKKSSGLFTIPPHSKQVLAEWYVHAGSHTILVAWGYDNPEPFISYNDYYLMPYTTKNVIVDATSD